MTDIEGEAAVGTVGHLRDDGARLGASEDDVFGRGQDPRLEVTDVLPLHSVVVVGCRRSAEDGVHVLDQYRQEEILLALRLVAMHLEVQPQPEMRTVTPRLWELPNVPVVEITTRKGFA